MPENKDPAELVEATAEAVKELIEDKGDRKSDGPFSDHKIRSLAALILASTSLLATLGTFIKTCDHSVSQNTYTTLTDGIQKVTDNEQQNHDDIVAIRAYLDGLARAPLTGDAGAGVAFPLPSASSSSTLRPLIRPLPTATATLPHDGGLITFAIETQEPPPPPPPVHSGLIPWKAKPWSDVAAGK